MDIDMVSQYTANRNFRSAPTDWMHRLAEEHGVSRERLQKWLRNSKPFDRAGYLKVRISLAQLFVQIPSSPSVYALYSAEDECYFFKSWDELKGMAMLRGIEVYNDYKYVRHLTIEHVSQMKNLTKAAHVETI